MSRDLLFVVDRLQSSFQMQDVDHVISNPIDFISQMPDDILVKILSLLNIKDAVATSILSARWRFLWCSLNKLRFYSHKRIFGSETDKYIHQVNSVIQRHSFPVVQEFRICFNLNSLNKGVLDEWLQFAANKKVEFLELNFISECCLRLGVPDRYDFPSRLFERNLTRSKPTVVELVSLKKLILMEVNVTDSILQEFLTNSPRLEMISIHHPRYLNHIHVGGRPLNLKHFEIVDYNSCVKSIYLGDFGLESFTYRGLEIDIRLARLPKLKELVLDFIEKPSELNNNMFPQIASFASSLQLLHLLYPLFHKKSLMLDSFPKLPNVKNLRIKCGHEENCLQHLVSMANACPNLHTFTIQDPEKELCFAHRPKHKQLDGLAGLNNNVCDQMSSCLPFPNLSIDIYDYMGCLFLNSFPGLPYVTNLTLTHYGDKRDCLMDMAFIMNACPNLKTFTIKPLWTSPIMSRRKAKRATRPFEHLELVVILGYYGRICDNELALYILRRAVALKKIVIDTRYQAAVASETARSFSMNKGAAQSHVKCDLIPILRRGVELVIHCFYLYVCSCPSAHF